MDTAYPARYPSSGIAPIVHDSLKPGQASSLDYRLKTDFQFLDSVNFIPARGYYFFSNYRYSRFDYYYSRTGDVMYEYRQYENELYKAEAYANLNQLDNALAILNNQNNPRLMRGYLVALGSGSTKQEILNAIFYERDIELIAQGFMLGFCDMRRRDMLQYGTPLHFPVPGEILDSLKMQYYTFGGVANADGINTSNGGWFDNNVNVVNAPINSNEGLIVYPNPANNILYINIKEKSLINVYNENGIVVLKKQLTDNQINISSLPKGLYIIEASFGKYVRFAKFCKE